MNSGLEYKGFWFLPTEKNKRISGVLKYDSDEGCSLELFGNFNEFPLFSKLHNEDIIQGITSDSKQITLYKCFIIKIEGAKLVLGEESGMPSTIYRVNYILEGVHINLKSEITFKKIVSEIHNLDEWIGVSGFERTKFDLDTLKNHEIKVNYKLPKQINFTINKNLEGQFNFMIYRPGLSMYQKSVELNQKVELIITSKESLEIENLLKQLFNFQNLLILGLYNKTYPKSITLYDDKFITDYGSGQIDEKKIILYFPISNQDKKDKPKLFLEMLFGYVHIKDEFSKIIKNWYAKYDLLEPTFNLLFEQFYNNERFSENAFLNLAQAAETFHARLHNHTKMPKDKYNEMKADILSLVPKDYHNWLEEQFNFGNNLNLHSRLTEIVTMYSNEILDKIIGDKEVFVKQVKWSRNYYTHYSSSGKKNALKGAELFYLTEKLKIILVCAILIEVGFDKSKLSNLLEQNKHRFFNHLVNW